MKRVRPGCVRTHSVWDWSSNLGKDGDYDVIDVNSAPDASAKVNHSKENTTTKICEILSHSQGNFVLEIKQISWSCRHPTFFKYKFLNTILIRKNRKYPASYPILILSMLTTSSNHRWSDSKFLLSDPILFLKNGIRIQSESCFGWNHTIRIWKLSESVL